MLQNECVDILHITTRTSVVENGLLWYSNLREHLRISFKQAKLTLSEKMKTEISFCVLLFGFAMNSCSV